MVTRIPPPPNILQEAPKDFKDVARIVQAQNRYIFDLYKIIGPGQAFASATIEQNLPDDFDPGQPLDPNNTTLAEVAAVVNQNQANIIIIAALAAANDARLDALAAIAPLALTVTDPPTQSEVQNIADKVDAIIAAV